MEKTKHIPTPYYNNGGQIEHLDTETSYTQFIATVGVVNEQSLTDTANARFVVRACNSHDELLNACNRAHNRLLEMGQQESCRTLQILRTAIDNAEK